MTIQSRMMASSHRLVSHFGGGSTITLRRPHDLRNANDGERLTALSVSGVTALGATSIDLDSVGLEGTLPAGIELTIAGVSGTYTTQADVIASSGALSSVSILPALASEATDNAAVTVAASASYTAAATAMAPTERDLANTQVHESHKILVVSASDLSIEPKDTDEPEWDGKRESIVLVMPRSTTGTPSGYRLVVGTR